MSRRIIFIVMMLMAFYSGLQAQTTYTVSGIVKDSILNEPVQGAVAGIKELNITTNTDANGAYQLEVPPGNYTLVISSAGLNTQYKNISVQSDVTVPAINMSYDASSSTRVKVKAQRRDDNVQNTKISTIEIDVKQIQKLPALFGEVDVIKNIQTLPGVQIAGEGNTGLYVRGGGADQNLILYDEAPIYNASHLLGIFSIFSADALKSAELYKGGIPAQYGGRLSSLLDIRSREGNAEKFHGQGGVGIIASRLTLEGPGPFKNSSWLVSGRRTYGDLFLKLSSNPDVRQNALYFYDLNLKYSQKLNDKNSLYYSGYFGRDIFKFQDFFKLGWGNSTSSLRWEHKFSDRFTFNSYVIASDYLYKQALNVDPAQNFEFSTRVSEISLKEDFVYTPNTTHSFNFGLNAAYRTYNPGAFEPQTSTSIFKTIKMDKFYSFDGALYLADKHKITNRLMFEYGVRLSMFTNLGAADVYSYDGDRTLENISDTTHYGRGEPIVTYGGIEPRFSGRYKLNEISSIKVSYNRMKQYVHLVSNSLSPVPFNIWIPSTPHLKPEIADQVAGGYFRNLKDNMYEISAEVYYKKLNYVVDFIDNADLLLNKTLETQIRAGKGWSYGLELFVRKNKGQTTGWISYTLSKSDRQTPDINNGLKYAASYDRRHNFNLVVSHDFNERINLSGNWVFGTGRPIGLPIARFEYDNIIGGVYPERNSQRLPYYHRMDLALTINAKKKEGRKWEGSWNFSVYNFYARKNPFTIFTRDKENAPGQKELVMIYFPAPIPSVTYNFKF